MTSGSLLIESVLKSSNLITKTPQPRSISSSHGVLCKHVLINNHRARGIHPFIEPTDKRNLILETKLFYGKFAL